MVGKAEIIVGAQIDDVAPRPGTFDRDMRPLRRQNRPLVLGQPLALDALECRGRAGKDGAVHGLPLD
jgi:hypothetical protein